MAIKILIDAGHGGSETGAVANGYIEKNLNLETAKLFNAELQRCGFETVMSRTTDIAIDVVERGTLAKRNNCTCIISCHFNAMDDHSGKGAEVIHSLNNDSAKWIALCIEKDLVAMGFYERGVWTRESSEKGRNYYGVLRGAEPLPGVIIEPLFLDNSNEAAKLKQPGFLKSLAVAYCQGVCTAYGIKYVPESIGDQYSCLKLYESGATQGRHNKNQVCTFEDIETILLNLGIIH
jgi:N-acetylmuramoyl-L-alanine amidase